MADFFNEILNMSINASWLILAVMLYRLCFYRNEEIPKWCTGLLWAMVGIRLVIPFSIEHSHSLIPSAQTIPTEIIHDNTTADISGAEVFKYIGNNPVWYSLGYADGSIMFNEICAPDVDTINPLFLILSVAFVIWLVGVAALLIYAIISCIKLKNKISTAVLLRDNIYQSEAVASPFILGIIKPKIYIPYGLSQETLQYVEAHENAHLKRFDHITKPLGFLILCVHWFNPLVWIAYNLFCKDIELACDEKVIRNMEIEKRNEYATAILECGITGKKNTGSPLAFGETSIKQRVKNALKYKKPAFFGIITAILMCIVCAIHFMTIREKPEDKSPSVPFTSIDSGSSHEGVKLTVTELNLEGDNPTITVEWSNKLDNIVYYGEIFDVLHYENGKWESCLKPDTDNFFHLPAYMLYPDSTEEMVYNIKNFDFSKSGYYRVIVTYDLDIHMDTSLSRNLTAYAGFEISEAATVNPGESIPVPDESATVNNEFVGIQAGSIPYTRVLSEKYLIPDGYDDVPIFAGASNRHKLYLSMQRHLPTYAIRSVDELENYKRMTLGVAETAEASMLNKYDEAFFEENMLIMINSLDTNVRFGYGLIGVYSSGSDVWATLECTHPTNFEEDDMAYGINIAIEVKKDLIENAERFDSWVERDVLAD